MMVLLIIKGILLLLCMNRLPECAAGWSLGPQQSEIHDTTRTCSKLQLRFSRVIFNSCLFHFQLSLILSWCQLKFNFTHSPWTQVETKKASGLWTSYFNAPDACSYADISFFARTWAQGGVFLFASCTGCKATASHHALLFQMALNEWREAKNIQRFLPQVRRTSLLFVCGGWLANPNALLCWCFCFVRAIKYAHRQCYVRHF